MTKGRFSARVDPKELPVGPFLRDLLGDTLEDAEPVSESELVDEDDDPLVVHKVGKRWYVSLNWSIGAAGRTTLPPVGAGVPAKGAATPEAAVSDLMTAMADLDVRRMIELMPPDELPALHDLAGEYIDDVERDLEEVRDFYELRVQPQLRTTELAGDRVLVSIVDLPMQLQVDVEGNRLRAEYGKRALSGSVETEAGDRASFEATSPSGRSRACTRQPPVRC